ncbi:hypothetical protein Xen7305DRAFT_00020070 [Xenococcus sp. PCC 7305]|nr:hypothetical protein [Xenococcus sp. PCC 7305]ELS02294.1 hypothetical protein Xen7305DRAFT_00020070 [Xenococcus sp. PCC 7305]
MTFSRPPGIKDRVGGIVGAAEFKTNFARTIGNTSRLGKREFDEYKIY